MKAAFFLALALAGPAWPAELAPPRSLHPLLLGTLAEPGPLRQAVERHALALLALEPASAALPVGAVQDYLAQYAYRGAAAPVDRASALALARVLVDPPRDLGSRPVDRLARRLSAGDPFRGPGAASDMIYLRWMADMAHTLEPALDAAFDGRSDPRLGTSELYFKDGYVVAPKAAAQAPLRRGERSELYAHPGVPGALLRRYKPAVNASVFNVSLERSDARAAAERHAAAAAALAELGAGPRHLGLQTVPEGSIRPLTHVVSVDERVYGASVADLIDARRFDETGYELVGDLMRRLARAALVPGFLSPRTILIGITALDSAPRAYLVGAGTVRPDPGAGQVRYAPLLGRDVYDRRLPVYHDGVYAGLMTEPATLESLLREGLRRSARSAALDRLGDAFLGLIGQFGRMTPR